MQHFTFKKIDAFATPASAGNPAGYVRLGDGENITAAQMQRMAYELRGFVNEVGFARQLGEDAFALTFYSATREVDLCGHATVAILYDLIARQPALRQRERFTVHTRKGELPVQNRIATEDAVFIGAPRPVVHPCDLTPAAVAHALGITPFQLHPQLPVRLLNAGLNTLLVPVDSLATLLAIAPSLDRLGDFCRQHGIDIIEVFTEEVADPANDFRSRVFAPTFGYLEDPATGSGNAALGYYLLERGQ
ncbi:MAG TPA: PhzF family phenazine biosynthesis protein [Cytophagales bacterium]|jgi:PhzF family phenazine biosynthesis protein